MRTHLEELGYPDAVAPRVLLDAAQDAVEGLAVLGRPGHGVEDGLRAEDGIQRDVAHLGPGQLGQRGGDAAGGEAGDEVPADVQHLLLRQRLGDPVDDLQEGDVVDRVAGLHELLEQKVEVHVGDEESQVREDAREVANRHNSFVLCELEWNSLYSVDLFAFLNFYRNWRRRHYQLIILEVGPKHKLSHIYSSSYLCK